MPLTPTASPLVSIAPPLPPVFVGEASSVPELETVPVSDMSQMWPPCFATVEARIVPEFWMASA